MQDQPIPGHRDRGSTETNATKDLRDQGVVLTHVLTLHPAHLRLVELVREVTGGSTDFEDADRFKRAAQDLVGVGLLFVNGELLLPTRAALRFNEIVTAGV
jgi:hypothetical protein